MTMWDDLAGKLKSAGAAWPAYAALGSFSLYFLGYLTLRFQLSSFGVATDLGALDERYFFAGARFLVYLVAAIPTLLILALPVAAVSYLLRLRRRPPAKNSATLLLGGIVFSVLAIQLVMRQCFFFVDNLLLADHLNGPSWLHPILLGQSSGLESLFFTGLLASVCATAWFLIAARRREVRHPFGEALLALLLAVQFLLLPVNYGVLIGGRKLPRLGGAVSEPSWLVWEGKDQVTLLTETPRRALVTLPRAEMKRIEIVGYDAVLDRFFGKKTP